MAATTSTPLPGPSGAAAPPPSAAAVSQTSMFFIEHGEVMGLVRSLLAEEEGMECGRLVSRIATIFDRYQEQPHLLDPALRDIVIPLMHRARTILRSWHTGRQRALARTSGVGGPAPLQVYDNPYLHCLFKVVYSACKTRGYKAVVKLFPHEVADLEPALECLLCQDLSNHAQWEMRHVLLLWLSILVLVPFDLTTIDSSLHEAPTAATSDDSRGSRGGIIHRLVSACQSFLPDAGAVRHAAALCLARLLTRPDLDTSHLITYCMWATKALTLCTAPSTDLSLPLAGMTSVSGGGGGVGGGEGAGGSGAMGMTVIASGLPTPSVALLASNATVTATVSAFVATLEAELDIPAVNLTAASRVFLTTGVLQSLVEVAKHGHRASLRDILSDTFDRIVAIMDAADTTADSVPGTLGRGTSLRSSPTLRKLVVKLASRTGLSLLPPRLVSWRYQRGQRSLLANLSASGVTAAKAKQAGATHARGGQPSMAGQGDDDGEADVPPAMEDIVDMLLTGLRDTDTVVRWSAAKGVGRVTGRLPRSFADDVVVAVLQLLHPSEGDGAWHGGCLALAELARRGLLLPARLAEATPMVIQALAYDVRKGAHSVGQHVRDAACFVCWAFARAYTPTDMKPHVGPLASGMLITALFDREVNCRRAASAAFQENVGRQGHDNFPNGIEILTAADYFTLGNRAHAYLDVAPQVAVFTQYRYALLDHLLHVKLRHWDREVRELAAKSLARLAHLDTAWVVHTALPTLLPETVSTDLFTRHGAILGIAELVLALGKACVRLPPALTDQIRNVVVKAEQALAYRGRGGEMVRVAMCRLIQCQCVADHPLSRRAALRMLQTVDDCLRHPNDTIQAAALAALQALTHHAMCCPDPAALERLPKTYVARLNGDDNPAVRRGLSLALGALPRGILCGGGPGMLDSILDALIQASKQERQVSKRDAQTRRNAVMALADVTLTVGLGKRAVWSFTPAPPTPVRDEGVTTVAYGSSGGGGGDNGFVMTSAPPRVLTFKSPEGAEAGLPVGGGRIAALRAAKAAAAGATSTKSAAHAPGAVAGAGSSTKPDVTTATRRVGEHWLPVGEVYDGLTAEQFDRVWGALLSATHDYAVDNRGDVGSWVRKAACEGLERVAMHVQACAWVHRRMDTLRAVITQPAATAGELAWACAGLDQLWCPIVASQAVAQLTSATIAIGAALGPGAPSPTIAEGGTGAVGGFSAGIAGYGAGTRLVASAPHDLPDAVVSRNGYLTGTIVATTYGPARIQRVLAGGDVVEVAFQPGTHGATYFPYGSGWLPCTSIAPVLRADALHAMARAPARSGSGMEEVGGSASILHGFGVLVEVDRVEGWLTGDKVVALLGCLLRGASEKLDLLRGVTGEALCRLLHLPHPLRPLPGVAHSALLQVTFPAPAASVAARHAAVHVTTLLEQVTAAMNVAALSTPALAEALEHSTGVPSAKWIAASHGRGVGAGGGSEPDAGEGDDAGHAPGPDAADDVATPSESGDTPVVEDVSAGPAGTLPTSTSLQWAIPHQSFPRIVPVLSLPEYAAPLLEGLVTSVGGLSESVVKHSSAALCAWAAEAKRGGRTDALAHVGTLLTAMLRPRRLQPWDELVEGATGAATTGTPVTGGSSGGGYVAGNDPSMGRWFREILGTGAGGDGKASPTTTSSGTKLDARLVTPALRTLDALLTCHAMDALLPPHHAWALDTIAACRSRIVTAKDDAVRIMAAGAVTLGFLHFPPPVRHAAVQLALDVLLHPFPKVRKTMAEGLYIKLLTMDESAFPVNSVDGGGSGVDATVAALTEAPWDSDAALSNLVGVRDGMYAMLGVPMPPVRSGVGEDAAAVFGGTSTVAAGVGGSGGADDYSDLVREMGY